MKSHAEPLHARTPPAGAGPGHGVQPLGPQPFDGPRVTQTPLQSFSPLEQPPVPASPPLAPARPPDVAPPSEMPPVPPLPSGTPPLPPFGGAPPDPAPPVPATSRHTPEMHRAALQSRSPIHSTQSPAVRSQRSPSGVHCLS